MAGSRDVGWAKRSVCATVMLAAAFAGAACGSDSSPAADPPTSAPTDQLVVEHRQMTAAEYDRIDDDGEGGVLDCPDYGDAWWDYGTIGPDEPRGRTADDALRDAITDLNQQAARDGNGGSFPTTGWVALQEDENDVTFLHTPERWQYLVMVGGDTTLGVWRHHKAVACAP